MLAHNVQIKEKKEEVPRVGSLPWPPLLGICKKTVQALGFSTREGL